MKILHVSRGGYGAEEAVGRKSDRCRCGSEEAVGVADILWDSLVM